MESGIGKFLKDYIFVDSLKKIQHKLFRVTLLLLCKNSFFLKSQHHCELLNTLYMAFPLTLLTRIYLIKELDGKIRSDDGHN